MRRLRARLVAGDDRGTSLTELIVVMLIMGVVVAATATLTVGFQRTNAANVSRQDQVNEARTAVERMSKTLRTAVKPSQLTTSCGGAACEIDAFFMAKDYSVQFYANLDNQGNSTGPKKITYAVASTGANAGVLIEKVQVPDSNTPTETGYVYCDAEAGGASTDCKARLTTRRVADGIVTVGQGPIFKYYDSAGARLTVGSAGLSATDLEKVLSIELVVVAQSTGATKPDATTYIQRLTLPNSQAVIRSGEDETP